MRILSDEAINAVVAYLNSPSHAALAALARSFHPHMEPQSVAYLAKHFQVLLEAARGDNQ
jgi:hypothetical protein